MTEQIVFYVFAAMVLFSALAVVTMKNLVRSIFLFFVTLFSMAGLFVFALADFVAVTQIVIYVGGVLVLMIFAFLLSDKALLDAAPKGRKAFVGVHYLPGLAVALLFFAVLVLLVWQANPEHIGWVQYAGQRAIKPSDNTIHFIGINLMTKYLIPFEVVSVLLMLALIGAAHLTRKERKI